MQKRKSNKLNIQLIQLVLSLIILGGILAIRAFSPQKTEVFLSEYINNGFDTTQTLNLIGEEFINLFNVVPKPSTETSIDLPATDTSLASQPSSQTSLEIDENNEVLTPLGENGIGGFDEPIILLEEEFFSQYKLDDEIDDTYPIPFGTVKPDKVDYNIYQLGFETCIPVTGDYSSTFGFRDHPVNGGQSFHYGSDIAATTGTEIKSFGDGSVVATGNSSTYGLYIMVKHTEEYITLYAHCSKLIAKDGTTVKKGDIIAKVGATGQVTGPHLHFEIRKNNSLLNPEYYL